MLEYTSLPDSTPQQHAATIQEIKLSHHVQQPISENGSLTWVYYKEGNKWNRNGHQKCNRGKKQWRIWKSVHIIQDTMNGYVLGWHWG